MRRGGWNSLSTLVEPFALERGEACWRASPCSTIVATEWRAEAKHVNDLASCMEPLLARLGSAGSLSSEEQAALSSALSPMRSLAKGACLLTEGDVLEGLPILLTGLALSSRRLPDGAQQHLALHTAGEIVDHAGFVLGRATVSTCAIAPSLFVSIPRAELNELSRAHPRLSGRIQLEVALNMRRAQELATNVGRRSALARMAHMMCELDVRLAGASSDQAADVALPLTQTDLSDLLGLSVVHTNRVLQELRRAGLIELARGRLRVLDKTRLYQTAEFDPSYLAFA